MKSNKHITRAEALRKMGKYSALTATATFMLLNPKKAAADSPIDNEGGDSLRPNSIWKD